MIETFLALFIWLFAPIPWAIIAIHVLVKSGLWNSAYSKAILIIVSLLAWDLSGLLLLNNHDILFAYKFDASITQFFGVIVLAAAIAIEFLTQKALGTRRIFGSSELKQIKDNLVTHGIYRFARHPRYIEHPMWALGLGLVSGYSSLIWFFFYLLIGFMLVAYFEEQELVKRYGKQYLAYKRKTPAFFIRV